MVQIFTEGDDMIRTGTEIAVTSNEAAPSMPVEAPSSGWRLHKEEPLFEAAICILRYNGGDMTAGNSVIRSSIPSCRALPRAVVAVPTREELRGIRIGRVCQSVACKLSLTPVLACVMRVIEVIIHRQCKCTRRRL
jgi:hypothetical protein